METHWPYKPELLLKENTLVRFAIGKKLVFMDSYQLMNSSLDNIAKTMLNKEKMDMGVNMFTLLLLKEWQQDKTQWEKFKAYLERDCSLLIDIILKLRELFRDEYNFLLGAKSTISSTAMHIFFEEFYTIKSSEKYDTSLEANEFIEKYKNEFIYLRVF